MTTLLIARHGNTFGPEETPTRVGARTDLPLVEKGREQARAMGQYLKAENFIPDQVFSSHLKRTYESAEIILDSLGQNDLAVTRSEIFNEIDYGPDENKPEEDVIKRIGAEAVKAWDEEAIVPEGWMVNPDQIIQNWKNFAQDILGKGAQTTLVVTSNGIARFAPYLTNDFAHFKENYKIKLSTGALGILVYKNGTWHVQGWNILA